MNKNWLACWFVFHLDKIMGNEHNDSKEERGEEDGNSRGRAEENKWKL